jgi:hypothetical protein
VPVEERIPQTVVKNGLQRSALILQGFLLPHRAFQFPSDIEGNLSDKNSCWLRYVFTKARSNFPEAIGFPEIPILSKSHILRD